MEDRIDQIIEYLGRDGTVAAALGATAATLLDKRAYTNHKAHLTDSLRRHIHEITLSSHGLRAIFADTSSPVSRSHSNGLFFPMIFDLPLATASIAFKYQVCISYAREDLPIAKRLAKRLGNSESFRVFFDEFLQYDIVGENLTEFLHRVYATESALCVVLFSHAYTQKDWTRHELRAARDRAVWERGPYIIPVELEEGAIPSELRSTAYWRHKKSSESDLAQLITNRVIDSQPDYWTSLDDITASINHDRISAMILEGFSQGVKQHGEGEHADLLRLLGLITISSGDSLIPSVRGLLDFIVAGVEAVSRRFDSDDSVLVFNSNARVRRWLGKDGPLLIQQSGWSEHISAWTERLESADALLLADKRTLDEIADE